MVSLDQNAQQVTIAYKLRVLLGLWMQPKTLGQLVPANLVSESPNLALPDNKVFTQELSKSLTALHVFRDITALVLEALLRLSLVLKDTSALHLIQLDKQILVLRILQQML